MVSGEGDVYLLGVIGLDGGFLNTMPWDVFASVLIPSRHDRIRGDSGCFLETTTTL